ncbi:MAG: aspartate aminotransferase family protein [Deltaproteobacteria bacterium CG11_big_fil_rev_8_21_14_0_20_49_13]|nr:MAG: aspartate aminotransferase family protein [Deltaproteobacteria bacterium CG11_big_fil_rev_8_21_14_0_20_49_13]
MNIQDLFHKHIHEQHDIYANNINPQFVKVLRTIGFDKNYVKAEGQYLYDKEGNKYLDFLAGYGVFNMGRNHPKVKKALHEALDMDTANMVQMDAPLLAGVLAKKLLEKVNSSYGDKRLDRVFFTNSGTEANEGAIKFAKCATGRPRIVYLEHAFHGLSTGSLALNGNEEFRSGFGDLLPGCVGIPSDDLKALEYELAKKDIAAFIFEVVQGKGVYAPSKEYFAQAEALCRKYGTLMIADEVQSGMGRTGRWFAFEHFGLNPDIVTIAKALSGGFVPVGAILYREKIYDKVFSRMDRCVVHSNTFGRNTLAMAAGITTLSVIEEEGLVENAAIRGKEIVEGVAAMKEKYEMLSDVRGYGLMIAIEFDRPKSMKLKIGWDLIHKVNKGLFGQMVVVPLLSKHKILTQVTGHNCDIVKLLPPLCITSEDVRYFLASLEDIIADCHKFPGGAWEVGKELAKRAISA